MGCASESIAYGLIVASYRRRLGIVVVREFARHRYRQSQLVGLTRFWACVSAVAVWCACLLSCAWCACRRVSVVACVLPGC